MKTRKTPKTAEKPARVPPGGSAVAVAVADPGKPSHRWPWWVYAAGLLAALFLAFELYGPALHGEFLFDDHYLPFLVTGVAEQPLGRIWLGVRPATMFSYWLNYQSSALNPYPYHAVNVLLHAWNALLAWLLVRRYLAFGGETGRWREWLAIAAGAIFLVHPLQTEAVAYVTSRSETLSVFFFLSALAVFVYRRAAEPIGWGRTAAVLLLFALAAASKEHAVVLPALLALTDYYFTTPFRLEALRRNWRLYLPILAMGAAAAVFVFRLLATADSAGFALKDIRWYEYLFTQFRSIPHYLRLYLLPVGQNADYVWPVSRSPLEHGAWIGLLLLLAGAAAAWIYRRRFPLASFGYFGFLLLLAPTSSIVPIRDVVVERRAYLPFLCLLLITVELLRRLKASRSAVLGGVAVVCVLLSAMTYQRNRTWSDALSFWSDVVEKSPANSRGWFQLAYAQWHGGNCKDAAATYERVAKMQARDERLLLDWALALECAGRPDDAIERLREAAGLHPTAHIFATIGMIYGKQGKGDEALDALATAERLDPRFEMLYVYRGNVHLTRGDAGAAAAEYRRALDINPANQAAKEALAAAMRP